MHQLNILDTTCFLGFPNQELNRGWISGNVDKSVRVIFTDLKNLICIER